MPGFLPSLESLSTIKGTKQLNGILQKISYLDGYQPTQVDCSYFDAIGKVSPDDVNLYRWYTHIAAFTVAQRAKWPGTYVEAAAAVEEEKEESKAAPAAAAADDDDDDDDELFGDDDDLFDEEADAAAEARIAAAAAAHNAKKEAERIAKGKAVARSKLSYQFEVKPLEAGQDMEGLAQNIKKLSHDGIVTWGEQHKIVDVAFGIQKVLVQVIIYEDACCEDDLVDLITENFEDEVQSVDLIAMTKL